MLGGSLQQVIMGFIKGSRLRALRGFGIGASMVKIARRVCFLIIHNCEDYKASGQF